MDLFFFLYSRNPSSQATSCCVYPLSPTLSALPETRHVLASVKAKEIAQQQSKRGKIKEKMRNKEKKGERRTPKADDSRNFDADDDAVILANTNTILHTISVGLGECYPLELLSITYLRTSVAELIWWIASRQTELPDIHMYIWWGISPLDNNS